MRRRKTKRKTLVTGFSDATTKTPDGRRTPKPGGVSSVSLPREASWSAPALWRFAFTTSSRPAQMVLRKQIVDRILIFRASVHRHDLFRESGYTENKLTARFSIPLPRRCRRL